MANPLLEGVRLRDAFSHATFASQPQRTLRGPDRHHRHRRTLYPGPFQIITSPGEHGAETEKRPTRSRCRVPASWFPGLSA